MNEVLEPLARIPGVRLAALVMEDGVPVAIQGQSSGDSEGEDDGVPEDDPDVFTGLVASWMADLKRQVGQMSWSAPGKVMIRAARGTVLMWRADETALLVLLERGMRTEDLTLPMGGAMQRLERICRGLRQPTTDLESVPGIHTEKTIPLTPDRAESN